MNVRFHLLVPFLVQGMLLSPLAGRAQQAAAPPTQEELQRLLRQRDAVITDLLHGVEQLERRLEAPPPQPVATKAKPAAQEKAAETTPPVPTAAEPAAPAGAAPPAEAAAKPTGPGQVVVDEQAAERALERSLVSTGVLLLAPGQVEISPSLSYTRDDSGTPAFLNQNGATFAASNNFRRNTLDAALDLSFGMPFNSQLEFGLPYSWVDQSSVTTVGGQSRRRTASTARAGVT